MQKIARALVVDPRDNVAVALAELTPGQTVDCGDSSIRIAGSAVPIYHKLALCAISKNSPVLKYGAVIGVATTDIAQGSHVHVHNMASASEVAGGDV